MELIINLSVKKYFSVSKCRSNAWQAIPSFRQRLMFMKNIIGSSPFEESHFLLDISQYMETLISQYIENKVALDLR